MIVCFRISRFIDTMISIVRTAFYATGVTFLIGVVSMLFLKVTYIYIYIYIYIYPIAIPIQQITRVTFLTALEVRSPTSSCWWVWFLLRLLPLAGR